MLDPVFDIAFWGKIKASQVTLRGFNCVKGEFSGIMLISNPAVHTHRTFLL